MYICVYVYIYIRLYTCILFVYTVYVYSDVHIVQSPNIAPAKQGRIGEDDVAPSLWEQPVVGGHTFCPWFPLFGPVKEPAFVVNSFSDSFSLPLSLFVV